MTDAGQAVICDFGLSHLKRDIATKSHDEAATKRAIAGTVRWQSPERLAGGRPTWQCDVYAFAMAVFEVSAETSFKVHVRQEGNDIRFTPVKCRLPT